MEWKFRLRTNTNSIFFPIQYLFVIKKYMYFFVYIQILFPW